MLLILISFFADSVNLKLLEALPYDLPIFIEINDNFLYTCGGDFAEYITTYSLNNPYHPQIISQCIKDVNMSKGKMGNSHFLYYNDRLYKSSRIINVEDPYNIFHEGEITPDVGIRFMQIRDTILFVDCITWAPYEIHTYSLSDPSSPLYLSMYESNFLNPINEQRFFVVDTLCFITDGLGFEIVNVRDPENMYIISTRDSIFKNQGHNFDITGKNDYLYLLMVFEIDTTNKGDVFSEETLFTIDCSEVDSILVADRDFIGTVNEYPTNCRLSSIIKDTLLYTLSDPYYDTSYIACFSLINPDNPSLLDEYYGGGIRRIEGFVDLDYSDSLLYVSRGQSGISVHDPSLYERGYSCYSGYTERIIQKNNVIYTGTYGSGIRIFKETSDTIYELTKGGQPYDIMDISIFDTLLYASSEFGSFLIFSIKDSLNPILLYEDTSFSFYSDSFWCEKIAVDTEYIYLTRNSRNLARFYILDRTDYSILSTLDSVYGNINIRDTIGFVGDKILNISDKTDPSIITDLDGAYSALKDFLLYLSNGKLFSVAKIDSPVLLSTLEGGKGEFRGDSLYICDGGQPSEIYVYDISKPDSAYLVAYGNRPTGRQEILCAYPTLNRRIFTDGCYYIGFIEQGGIEEESQEHKPSKIAVDYLHFNFNDRYLVSIYDITGRKILKKNLDGEGRVYIRDLSQGVYFVSIPEKNLWKKIIIIH